MAGKRLFALFSNSLGASLVVDFPKSKLNSAPDIVTLSEWRSQPNKTRTNGQFPAPAVWAPPRDRVGDGRMQQPARWGRDTSPPDPEYTAFVALGIFHERLQLQEGTRGPGDEAHASVCSCALERLSA
jgi:hypothetical protein